MKPALLRVFAERIQQKLAAFLVTKEFERLGVVVHSLENIRIVVDFDPEGKDRVKVNQQIEAWLARQHFSIGEVKKDAEGSIFSASCDQKMVFDVLCKH